MRHVIAFLSPFAILFVWAAMAQAVTFDYCEYSLRGNGSLAPDNDVKRAWDLLEADTLLNIVSSHRGAVQRFTADYVTENWVFVDSYGRSWYGTQFYCNDRRPFASYIDGRY